MFLACMPLHEHFVTHQMIRCQQSFRAWVVCCAGVCEPCAVQGLVFQSPDGHGGRPRSSQQGAACHNKSPTACLVACSSFLSQFLRPSPDCLARCYGAYGPRIRDLSVSGATRQALVERLHGVLRPFLLRRLKAEVEKALPPKKEHVVRCRLSKRQRTLYEDYMASSDTASTLSSGNFLGIINVLMQLRKVATPQPADFLDPRRVACALQTSRVVCMASQRVWRCHSIDMWDIGL